MNINILDMTQTDVHTANAGKIYSFPSGMTIRFSNMKEHEFQLWNEIIVAYLEQELSEIKEKEDALYEKN